jgi:hypothetical protein
MIGIAELELWNLVVVCRSGMGLIFYYVFWLFFFLLTVCPRARTMEQKIIPDLHRGIDGDSQIAQNRMRM